MRGELASLSIPQIILVYDAQRHIELFSCVSSDKHRQVRKSEMHDFALQDCVSCFATFSKAHWIIHLAGSHQLSVFLLIHCFLILQQTSREQFFRIRATFLTPPEWYHLSHHR